MLGDLLLDILEWKKPRKFNSTLWYIYKEIEIEKAALKASRKEKKLRKNIEFKLESLVNEKRTWCSTRIALVRCRLLGDVLAKKQIVQLILSHQS